MHSNENELEEESEFESESENEAYSCSALPMQKLQGLIVHIRGTKSISSTDSKDFCFYCLSAVTSSDLMQHLCENHSSEPEVAPLLHSKNDQKAFSFVRNIGNFRHNIEVLNAGGELVVVQRPSNDEMFPVWDLLAASKHRPCRDCYGFFSKLQLREHKCALTSSSQMMAKTIESLPRRCNPFLDNFLNRLTKDRFGLIVRSDETILRFVSSTLSGYRSHNYSTIASKSRLLAELLVQFRKDSGNEAASTKDMLHPSCLETMKRSLVTLFYYRLESGHLSVKRASSLTKIARTLLAMAEIEEAWAVSCGDLEAARRTRAVHGFLSQHVQPMSVDAVRVLRRAKSDPPDEQTAIKIAEFRLFVDRRMKDALKRGDREALTAFVLAKLLQFNKRRFDEVEKLERSTWAQRHFYRVRAMKDLFRLDSSERVMIRKCQLVYVPDKSNALVPILFPPESLPAMDWLYQHSWNSNFLFSNGAEGFVRAQTALNRCACEAGIKEKLVSCTKFRTYTTLIYHLENYDEADFRTLAMSLHRGAGGLIGDRWFRHRNSTSAMAQVAGLLLKAEKNHLRRPWGKEVVCFLSDRFQLKIKQGRAITAQDAQAAIAERPDLCAGRSWRDVKNRMWHEAKKWRTKVN